MRHWLPTSSRMAVPNRLAQLIALIGEEHFEHALLTELQELVTAGSYAIYRTGQNCTPQLFLSSSLGTPDNTHACWNAYRRGIYLHDSTQPQARDRAKLWISHITAAEISKPHRQAIYEAHGIAERIAIHKPMENGAILALNYYRHDHQRPFSDTHVDNFEGLATPLLALVEKHIGLCKNYSTALLSTSLDHLGIMDWRQHLQALYPGLTSRELDVCLRLLQGLTQEGIAADLGISVPTVKTYRNRAFERMGIYHRNQLFAVMHGKKTHQRNALNA